MRLAMVMLSVISTTVSLAQCSVFVYFMLSLQLNENLPFTVVPSGSLVIRGGGGDRLGWVKYTSEEFFPPRPSW